MKKLLFITISLTFLLSCNRQKENEPFHFYVVTDVHMTKSSPTYTSLCFKDKILPDIKKDPAGVGKFLVITGDLDPFFRTKESVEEVMGKDFRYYPVVGNHDVGMTNNKFKLYPSANWGNAFDIVKYNKNRLKNIVNWGPEYRTPALDSLVYVDSLGQKYISTYDSLDVIGSKYTTYSFDEGNSHFVVLDIYSGLEFPEANHSGRIFNKMYNWLEKDLAETKKENIFVFAHQPFWETGGEDTTVLVNIDYKRHCSKMAKTIGGADSLAWFKENYTSKVTSRKKFWNLLKRNNVIAYFCGHIHHYSVKKIDGVWEVNLQYGAWETEGKTKYGEVFVDKDKVDLIVKGFVEKPEGFKEIDIIHLKGAE